MTFRDSWLAALTIIMLTMTTWAMLTNARLNLLEAKHKEVVLENQFLSRKVQESHEGWIYSDMRRDLSLQLAVAGFRSGHYRAYAMMVTEARRNGFEYASPGGE